MLYRDGSVVEAVRLKLGSDDDHEVHEAEYVVRCPDATSGKEPESGGKG